MLIEERVELKIAGGNLNGRLIYPESSPTHGRVLLASPHPLLGGDIDNPALRAMAEGIATSGVVVLSFSYRTDNKTASEQEKQPFWDDFRVNSQNAPDIRDMRSVFDLLLNLDGCEGWTGVAGYSYGAALAVLLETKFPILALSPPLRAICNYEKVNLENVTLVRAEDDFAISEKEVYETQQQYGHHFSTDQIIRGADHFFRGHLEDVRSISLAWAKKAAAPKRP